jgi:hypothetical protein
MTLSATSNYTATGYLELNARASNYCSSGLMISDTVSGKIINFGMNFANGFFLRVVKLNSATSVNASYTDLTIPGSLMAVPNWLRIRDDGTNRYYEYSFNGTEWVIAASTFSTDFLTPNHVG